MLFFPLIIHEKLAYTTPNINSLSTNKKSIYYTFKDHTASITFLIHQNLVIFSRNKMRTKKSIDNAHIDGLIHRVQMSNGFASQSNGRDQLRYGALIHIK